MAKKNRAKGGRRKPSKAFEYGGDHGPGTAAAMTGTRLVPVEDENGKNPNNLARVVRVEHWQEMGLNLRQYGAANYLRNAFCDVEALSSGDELKEAVHSSPRPDATVDVQTETQHRLSRALRPIPDGIPRKIVDAILRDNIDPRSLPKTWANVWAQFKICMDLAANNLDKIGWD